jgi:hypothetical protein
MNEERDTDARLWHPWLRINRVLRVMLHTHWSATGAGWERTPWHAVQGAAWIALLHASITQGGTV